MVLVAATILPHTPAHRKGMASGAIFLGLGLGIAGSGTLIPLLLGLGLAQTWIGLGIFSALLTLISWKAWPSAATQTTSAQATPLATQTLSPESGSTRLLYLQYGLMAIACVPPMIFLVDFIARGLGYGTYLGSVFWAIYGLGAIAGPPLYGYLADRLGAQTAIKSTSIAMAIVFLAVYMTDSLIALGLLTLIIGTFAPGIVPLALARVHEVVTHNPVAQNVVWQRATLAAAAGMAVAAYAYSALFNATGGNHRLLFLSGTGLLALAMLTDLFRTSPGSRR
jgi:predicted MFS family arabinose efflux permease